MSSFWRKALSSLCSEPNTLTTEDHGNTGIVRVILHWTGGMPTPSAIDKKHYHYLVDQDGDVHLGDWPVEANINPVRGKYAAHTLNCNTGSIGIALCGMYGAVEGKTHGQYPITGTQVEAACALVKRLCDKHRIEVTPETVLSHAEVQDTLGIKQKAKWDISVLPYAYNKNKGARVVGDYLRDLVKNS